MASEKVPLHPPPPYSDDHTSIPTDSKSNSTDPLLSPNAASTTGSSAPARPLAPPGPPRPLNLPALNMIRSQRVILASASPRRRALLAQIGLTNVEIHPSTVPEDQSKTLAPFEYVLLTAEQKARNVYAAHIDDEVGEPALVLAADTIIATHYGQILEKPRSEQNHFLTLQSLRDSNDGWHKVYTAVVCMAPLASLADPGYTMETVVEETRVKFDPNVTDDLLWSYVRTREGADKAGGYAIQGLGSILVERIDGTFDNVVGLPLRATLQCIEKVIAEPAVPDEVMEVL